MFMSLYDEAASDCLFNQLVNHHLFQWLDGNDGSPAFFFPGLTKKSVGYSVLRANWFRVSRLQPRPFDGSPVALDLVWFQMDYGSSNAYLLVMAVSIQQYEMGQ